MKNFCPNCNRRTLSVLNNPTLTDEPILDESTGELEATIGLTLECDQCGQTFTDMSFKLEGVASETNEHLDHGHAIELTYEEPVLTGENGDYGLELTVELRCSCQEEAEPFATILCERPLPDEEIEEALE